MTNSFWVALAVLTVMALAFVFYPLFSSSRAQRQRITDRKEQNLENYRYRLAELELDRSSGRVDQSTFTTLKDELDAALLEDVGLNEPAREFRAARRGDRRSMMVVAIATLVALPIVSFVLYDRWGASDALVQAEAMRQLQKAPASPEEFEERLTSLRAHLERNPDNPDGWAMLGRANMQLQRYEAAANAYQGLAQQLSGEPIAATAWGLVAQARYLASQRQWNRDILDAIKKAREIDPDEANALGLLGIAAYEQGNYQVAAEHWTRILQVAPDYPQASSIANGVQSAYRAMGEPVPQKVRQLLGQNSGAAASDDARGTGSLASAPQRETADSKASIRLTVELSDELPAPDPEASVFIFARAANGPPMPLAVVRLKASDLPATVTLDDDAAMTSQAPTLSSADSVVLGARISASGTANAGSGDLEGISDPIPVNADMGAHTLVIDRQRP